MSVKCWRAQLDYQVRYRQSAAEQRISGILLRVAQCIRTAFGILDVTLEQFSAAGAALAAATTVGNQDIGRVRSIQYGLAGRAFETLAAWQHGDLERGQYDGVNSPSGCACCAASE